MVIIKHKLLTVLQTRQKFWYEDPSTVSAPVISFSGVTTPPMHQRCCILFWSRTLYKASAKIHLHMLLQLQMRQVICTLKTTKLINSDGQLQDFKTQEVKFIQTLQVELIQSLKKFCSWYRCKHFNINLSQEICTTVTSNHFTRMMQPHHMDLIIIIE